MTEVKFAFDRRLDTDFLDGLYDGDKEHASIIFEQFLQCIHGQLKDVEDNYNAGNSEQFRLKIHKIKPIFSFVGLSWLTSKAELIENQCLEHSGTAPVAQLYTDFKNSIFEFLPVIENEFGKLKV